MPRERWDVVVVGGGPAGLMAAGRAAARGHATILVEKNPRPGAKILISGGGHCNLTHATDPRGIVAAFGRPGRFLHSALAALGPRQLVELVEAEGVPTRVEPDGKVLPASGRAGDVLAAVLRHARRSGATLALGEPLEELEFLGEPALLAPSAEEGAGSPTEPECGVPRLACPTVFGALLDKPAVAPNPTTEVHRTTRGEGSFAFRLVTTRRTLWAAKVVLATGGCSYPGCGTTGDGYRWAAALGHTIERPRPALVPILAEAAWVLGLQGVTVPDVVVRVYADVAPAVRGCGAGILPAPQRPTPALRRQVRPLAEGRGALLFTHFGLSGPVVLDVSRAVSGRPHDVQPVLRCDFLPEVKETQLDAWLAALAGSSGRRLVSTLLAQRLPGRLAEALAAQAQLPPDRRGAELSRAERERLVAAVKRQPIRATGTLGFEKAEVTAGGVALDEIDSRTMRSKLVPGLFVAGELLDLDGPIGGYNLQAAFSTGWLAGERV